MNTAKPPPLPGQRSVAVAAQRRLNAWEILFRVAIAAALIISISLAWWEFARQFLPLQQESQALGAAVSHLSDEVEVYQRKWASTEVQQIRTSYKELRTQLFADDAALQAWLGRMDEAAGPLVLDLKVDFGKTTAYVTNEVNVAVMPASVSIEVHPMPGGTESPYQRLLRFGQQISAEGKRADLAELRVSGGTNSITSAVLVFNLWVGDETTENKTASAN